MIKDRLKEIKVIYYPYNMIKTAVSNIVYNINYRSSLANISRVKELARQKIENHEVLKVVFIVQYIPSWNKYEPIYEKMKKDGRFDPVILCVPSNIQDGKLIGDRVNDTYEYFTSHGYEAIDSLGEGDEWFDLEAISPDYVFHSRPYNSFMPNCYSSEEISKYALIGNVIYGTNLTENGQDVTLNRDYFKDVYVYFAFDKGEEQYYKNRFRPGIEKGIQKCLPYGRIGLEQMMDVKREKTSSDFRKTVIWTPRWSTDPYIGGSNFFNYKDTMTELARSFRDILFIFRPHPLMFDNFINTGEMSREEVDEFKQYCNDESNILLDESKEYTDTFWNSDILISDSSGIIPEYFVTEKPVLFCHSNVPYVFTDYAKAMIKSSYEVRNEKDLIGYFNDLINNNDYKLPERQACIAEYFGDVSNSSDLIIDFLAEGI